MAFSVKIVLSLAHVHYFCLNPVLNSTGIITQLVNFQSPYSESGTTRLIGQTWFHKIMLLNTVCKKIKARFRAIARKRAIFINLIKRPYFTGVIKI